MLHPEVTGATSTGSSTTGYEELFRSLFLHHTFFFSISYAIFSCCHRSIMFRICQSAPKMGGSKQFIITALFIVIHSYSFIVPTSIPDKGNNLNENTSFLFRGCDHTVVMDHLPTLGIMEIH